MCPNIYGQQKYPVRNVSGNIGYIKKVSFQKKILCPNIYGVRIFRVITVSNSVLCNFATRWINRSLNNPTDLDFWDSAIGVHVDQNVHMIFV